MMSRCIHQSEKISILTKVRDITPVEERKLTLVSHNFAFESVEQLNKRVSSGDH